MVDGHQHTITKPPQYHHPRQPIPQQRINPKRRHIAPIDRNAIISHSLRRENSTCSNDATRESTLTLAPNHPIRRLLTVFTYHATEVNLNAFDRLVPNTSILHRGTGLYLIFLERILYGKHINLFTKL